ncbi:MAG: heme-binding protein [Cryobacterium sp.]|nr:heme-binding protein [Oligoflexia bacterium]
MSRPTVLPTSESSRKGFALSKRKKNLAIASSALTAGAVLTWKLKSLKSLFGIRTAKGAEYLSEFKEGAFEIRLYSAHAVAEVTISGERDTAVSEGFRALFQYISGRNESGTEFQMTSPVSQVKVDGGWQSSFFLPTSVDLAHLPHSSDPRVRVFAVPSRRCAFLTFSGKSGPIEFAYQSRRLQNWIRNHGWTPEAAPTLDLYDPPFTLPYFKKNAVQIELG